MIPDALRRMLHENLGVAVAADHRLAPGHRHPEPLRAIFAEEGETRVAP